MECVELRFTRQFSDSAPECLPRRGQLARSQAVETVADKDFEPLVQSAVRREPACEFG